MMQIEHHINLTVAKYQFIDVSVYENEIVYLSYHNKVQRVNDKDVFTWLQNFK